MLLVGANAGLIGMAKEHLGIALALALPVFICVTKIDMTPAHVYESTIKQLTKVLKSPGCRKTPIFVENAHQAVEAAIRLGKDRVAPIFPISNVTGAGLDLVRLFLNTLPISGGHSQSFDASGESILGSLMDLSSSSLSTDPFFSNFFPGPSSLACFHISSILFPDI